MALSLSEFRSNVTDFARPNRFWVSVGDPSNDIAQFGANNNVSLLPWQDKHSFLAKSASLPGRTIGNIEVKWQGMNYNIAGDPTFNDITLTFHNNYEWDIRGFFEAWIEVQAQMSTNERSEPGSYKSDVITLTQLGRTEADIITNYKLVGAYPTDIAAIDLSMDSENGISEFAVTLKYDYFEIF